MAKKKKGLSTGTWVLILGGGAAGLGLIYSYHQKKITGDLLNKLWELPSAERNASATMSVLKDRLPDKEGPEIINMAQKEYFKRHGMSIAPMP